MKLLVVTVTSLLILFSGCGKDAPNSEEKILHEANLKSLNDVENSLSEQGLTFTSFPDKVAMNHCNCFAEACSGKASDVSRYIYYCHEVYGPDESMPAEVKTRIQAAESASTL